MIKEEKQEGEKSVEKEKKSPIFDTFGKNEKGMFNFTAKKN